VEAVNALHRQTRRRLYLEEGYLTTLVAAVIQADQVWIANLGDSRAYRVQAADRKVQQLTEDHSRHVQDVKAGLVDESDPDSRNAGVITRAIGLQEQCQADTYHYTWSAGDRLLLCSDGLAKISEEEIGALLLDKDAEGAARALVARAVEVDGSDNCTAVVAAWLLAGVQELETALRGEPTLLVEPGLIPPETSIAESEPVFSALPVSELLESPPEVSASQPAPEGAARARHARRTRSPAQAAARRRRTRAEFWILMFGIVLGWLSAALVTLLLLNYYGVITLF
jgi:hypothetical protein